MQEENLKQITGVAIETILRIVLLGLVLYWGFNIISPFVGLVIWGVVIAAAVLPLYNMLLNRMNGKRKLSATLFTLALLALLITPSVEVANSVASSMSEFSSKWESGTLEVPPPKDKVKEWPVVGKDIYAFWLEASENLQLAAETHRDTITRLGSSLFSTLAGVGVGVAQFAVSIIIAGVFLATAPSCTRFCDDLSIKLAGEQGATFTKMAGDTISSVAKGVLGVAVIQAILASIGLIMLGVPAAGVWAILVLIVAIMQLPPIIILGPIAAWAYSVFDPTASTIFLVYSLLVSSADGILKPMLLGRGLSTPMPVILLGAIGGMVMLGILGLFIGAVILALIYELFYAWLYGEAALLEEHEKQEIVEGDQVAGEQEHTSATD